jgi:hypothetical protein
MKIKSYLFSLLLVIQFSSVLALEYEQIPITVSGAMDKIQFDGKWTNITEWKQTSLNEYYYDKQETIILRSAHQGNFVYIFLDAITDTNIDTKEDYAVVCFDTQNEKNQIPDSNDYCFMTTLDGGMGITYQGNSQIEDVRFEKIQNHPDFIALSTVSDQYDRYSQIPHASYEFKIPTELIGRQNIYGFYFTVYDKHADKFYSYPQNVTSGFIAPPVQWGEIYSPDKSLPEFGLPLLSLIFAMMFAFFVKTKLQTKT